MTAHTTWEMSATTSALDVVPLGVETMVDLQPVRGTRRDALLEEGLAGGPVGETLQQRRPAAGRVEQMLADLQVVRHQVGLRGVEGGEVDLVRSADTDLAPADLHDPLVVGGTPSTLATTTSGGPGHGSDRVW